MFKDGGDIVRREVRQVHLLFLRLKGLAELLDAWFGATHTIDALRKKQRIAQTTIHT